MITASLIVLLTGGTASLAQQNIDNTIARMNLREKVGQLFIFGFHGTQMSPRLQATLDNYHPGALIAFGMNVKTLSQIQELNRQILSHSRRGSSVFPFLMVDQEGGDVARVKIGTPLPSALALSETRSPRLIANYGRALGTLMSKLGFSVNLAPVLDLSDPRIKTFIGARSFGPDPKEVARMATVFAEGLEQGGVLPISKHFPGHGGILQDSHKVTPQKLTSLKQLTDSDLIPFRTFTEGPFVKGVMVGHISFPKIDPSDLPATFSSTIIHGILRNRMKFDGLVITDDVEMAGADAGGSVGERAIRAIQAGADMVMVAWTHRAQDEAFQAVLRAVQNGVISQSRLNKSLRRILTQKRSYLEMRAERGHELAAQPMSRSIQRLQILAEKIKAFNFKRAAFENPALRGFLADRKKLDLYSSDAGFFKTFRNVYGANTEFFRLTPNTLAAAGRRLARNEDRVSVYYVSGLRTARWLNRLPQAVKQKLIVVNTTPAGDITHQKDFLGVFHINTSAPESGAWLAQHLIGEHLRKPLRSAGL